MRKNLLITLCLCIASIAGAYAQTVSMSHVPVKKVTEATLNAPAAASGVSWKESFEGWNGSDLFWLPNGWTAKRTSRFMDSNDPHTWAMAKQLNMYYPAPVDGQYYICCYYNDDEEQDEWLYSPELSPSQNDYFTYYVILDPVYLFDMQYYDQDNDVLTQLAPSADLKLYVSVDGGEWEQVNSMYDLYKDQNINVLIEQSHNGYIQQRKMFVDMAPYAGKKVKFGFRYHGKGGNSIWLDDLELTPITMKAQYNLPSSTMYFGMTPDFQQPTNYLFMPDNTTLTWRNSSSLEAQTFDWAYANTSKYSQIDHKTNVDLLTTYKNYISRDNQVTGKENIAVVPTLTANGVGGAQAVYTHPSEKMVIGGKAEFVKDGVTYKTGASYCDPTKGYDILTTNTGVPYFGVGQGNKALWTSLFGTETEVIGVGMYIKKPAKSWKMRGLHVQGIGNITKAYKLSVTVRQFDIYGSVEPEPIATALIDVNNIIEQEDASGKKLYTLPFIFEDVVTVSRDVIITLNGLPEAATWFAPLQTAKYEESTDNSHAIFEYVYQDGDAYYSGMNYVSNLSVRDSSGKNVPCSTNFYFNFDMAYGDCDDWGHIDMEVPGPEMPNITCSDNTITLVDAESLESLYYEADYKPLVCGFYDEKDAEKLGLYVCIGELYEYEGGPFYSDKVNDTYYIKINMPKALVDGEEHAIDAKDITVDYYDMMTHSWLLHATQGTLKVKETAPHVYTVDVKALDARTSVALAARYVRPDEWRFRDFNELRPNPSVLDLTSGGRVIEHHDLVSCVVDQSDPELPVFYLAEEPNMNSLTDIMALDAKKYVRISCPTSLMDGLMKGFSGWANDDLTVTYMGIDYNHSGCQHDDTCYGGNVAVYEYDTENNNVNISSKIFTMTQYNMYNMTIHYEGPFVVDGSVDDGISNVYANENGNIYNIAGQRVNDNAKGIVIKNGKKFLLK